MAACHRRSILFFLPWNDRDNAIIKKIDDEISVIICYYSSNKAQDGKEAA